MIDMKKLRGMTSQEFCLLGTEELAYVKPITFKNTPCFLVSAADGRQLWIAEDYESAVMAVHEHDLHPVSVH